MRHARSSASPGGVYLLVLRLLSAGGLLAATILVACGGDEDGGATSSAAGQGGEGGKAGNSTAGQGGKNGGAGGSTVGGSGASGSTGTSGANAGGAGDGGSGQAGSGVSGTSGQSGAGTSGGSGQSGAGTSGSAGQSAAGSSGTSGQAGASGSAGQGGASSGAGGSTSGGQGGTAGASAGGQAGTSSAAGSSGVAGSAGAAGTTGAAGTGGGGTQPAPLGNDACNGYATRYWDCCKAHCSWAANVPKGVAPVGVCNAKDELISGANAANTPSSCDGPGPDSAYTCQSMTPWKVSDTLAYGFAAVPATGDICGRCYQVEFTGASHNAGNDPGSAALKGKTMIVQATNIGYDVGNGQFDILIPGGGVGAFNACSYQWKSGDLGAQYGGFLLQCKQQNPGASHEANKACVKAKCDSVFADPSLAELKDACSWFTGWYEAADNPNLRFAEVSCPDAIVKVSGVDRRPLNDIKACGSGGGSSCTPEQQASCNCDWTNGGTACGTNDGSCCWKACCGQ